GALLRLEPDERPADPLVLRVDDPGLVENRPRAQAVLLVLVHLRLLRLGHRPGDDDRALARAPVAAPGAGRAVFQGQHQGGQRHAGREYSLHHLLPPLLMAGRWLRFTGSSAIRGKFINRSRTAVACSRGVPSSSGKSLLNPL